MEGELSVGGEMWAEHSFVAEEEGGGHPFAATEFGRAPFVWFGKLVLGVS